MLIKYGLKGSATDIIISGPFILWSLNEKLKEMSTAFLQVFNLGLLTQVLIFQ